MATPERIFDLLHDYERRLEWDPFLRRAEVLGSDTPGVGVKTLCVAKWSSGGLGMETEYVSFDRPKVAAVRMTDGPWFFDSFAASIRQRPLGNGITRVTYRFNFELSPPGLARLLTALVRRVLLRETRVRLDALKRALERECVA